MRNPDAGPARQRPATQAARSGPVVPAVALFTALAAVPAAVQATAVETYACRIAETCASGAGCTDLGDDGPVVSLTVDAAAGTAVLGDERQAITMMLLSGGALGRTWLIEVPDIGVGLVTLAPDNTALTGTGHEQMSGAITATTMQAVCTPGGG